jgi:hypothetical protein
MTSTKTGNVDGIDLLVALTILTASRVDAQDNPSHTKSSMGHTGGLGATDEPSER